MNVPFNIYIFIRRFRVRLCAPIRLVAVQSRIFFTLTTIETITQSLNPRVSASLDRDQIATEIWPNFGHQQLKYDEIPLANAADRDAGEWNVARFQLEFSQRRRCRAREQDGYYGRAPNGAHNNILLYIYIYCTVRDYDQPFVSPILRRPITLGNAQ